MPDELLKSSVLAQCQAVFPDWAGLTTHHFDFDDPKGFSSFTMGIRSRVDTSPPAVLYRRLEDKENAILDFETEKQVFLTLGENRIAAHCHYYDRSCRMESFYRGRTLEPPDLRDEDTLRQIAGQLYRFHQLRPSRIPQRGFFEMMHEKWGALARRVLNEELHRFPENEQQMCRELREIYQPGTLSKALDCVPDGELTFCHNDTYHGNIMKLDSGEIKLLDFEFSCLNHRAYDFSNLFAETVMKHKQPEYPYFTIAEPEYGDRELGILIDAYLDHEEFSLAQDRDGAFHRLLEDVKQSILLSDFKYAMAALPLAVEPIQKIRFIPYAYQRFKKFLRAYDDRGQSPRL